MTHSTQAISPLRQRMIDDMRMRKFSPKTQNAYIRAVRRLAAFLGRTPDSASDEDLRRYQLHLVIQGISPISLNATITGLKFFFEFTVGDPERMAKMTPVQVPHKLPVILSREEVARLIEAAGEVPGSAIGGLRCRIARQRSHCAEGRRCRQPAHGAAR
jgi:integrase/recombinase XerD